MPLKLDNFSRESQYSISIRILFSVICIAILPLSSVMADNDFNKWDRGFTNKDLKGTYASYFEGEVVGVGTIASVGWLNPDGNGNISRAVRTISLAGVPIQDSVFTCTYSVNPDGTGTAQCEADNPAPGFPTVETFDFVLEDNGRSFHFVGTTPGVVVLGHAKRQ